MPLDKDTLYFIRLVSSGRGLPPRERYRRHRRHAGIVGADLPHGRRPRAERRRVGTAAACPLAEPPPRETRIRWALSAETGESVPATSSKRPQDRSADFSEEGHPPVLAEGAQAEQELPSFRRKNAATSTFTSTANRTKGDRILHEIGAHLYFDVPKHSEYVWDGVLIENHRTILNVRRNRTERELNALLVRLLEKDGTHGLAPGIQTPPATFNAIFLIRHAAVHFQKEGIVLRHLCDWACFLTRHWDEIDHALFRTAMEDYRMDRFADLMTAAAVEYLGAEVPGPECEAGMLGRFMEEVLTLRRCRTSPLPRLFRKLRPHTEPLAAARSAPDTRMEILLRYGARPVERNSPYSGSRRPQAPVRPAESAPGESWPATRDKKTAMIREKVFCRLKIFGFKNKELFLHRKNNARYTLFSAAT